jgi:hypothetical protein
LPELIPTNNHENPFPMKKFFTSSLTTTLFLLITMNLNAQFNIFGEFRMRGEYRDGYVTLRDSSKTPYADILGRARLGADYRTDKIMTRFSIQDAWVFGQNNFSSDTISKNTVNMFEAWFKYNFTKTFAVKVGRAELSYDDQRFLGKNDWSMWGSTHDLVMVQWDSPKTNNKADLGFAVNNTAPAIPTIPFLKSYTLINYKYMGFLWGQQKLLKEKLTISFLAFIDAYQKNSLPTTTTKTTYDTLLIRNSNDSIIGTTIQKTVTKSSFTIDYPTQLYAKATVGVDVYLNLKRWNFFVSGYYEGGHVKDTRKLSAWFCSANASFQVVKPLTLMAGYDYLSGNNYSDVNGQKTKVTSFSTPFGTSHRVNGYMDMWNAYVRNYNTAGLTDLYGRATINFTDKHSIEATYRWFNLAQGYLDIADTKNNLPYTKVDKSLGSEIDLMYIFKVIPNLDLNMAYCFYLQTHTMEIQRGLAVGTSKFAQYAYIMITYKPNFFTSEKK